MNKKNDFERLWCHFEFKNYIKSEAAKRGFTTTKEFTKFLVKQDDPLSFINEDKNEKKKWKFKI